MRRPLTTLALALLLPLAACGRAGAQDAPADPAQAEAAKRAGDAFLAKNATAPGIVVLPSGLQYRVLHAGPATGAHPAQGDEIKVHYEGKLVDGRVFDSTLASGQPAVMPLDHLVPGWMEALPLMRPGDEWELFIPSTLGYGDRGAGADIPPGAVLIFKLQLLGVLPQAKTGQG